MPKSTSELAFEQSVIRSLEDNGWSYRLDLSYTTEETLLAHWRDILYQRNVERLKDQPLTDDEFEQIKSQIFAINSPLEAARFLSTGQVMISRVLNGVKSDIILECFWSHDVAGGKIAMKWLIKLPVRKIERQGEIIVLMLRY